MFFVVGTGLLKISVLLFYRRIVSGTFKRRWKWAVWAAIGFTAAYSLALVLTLCLNCEPIQAYWKVLDPDWVQQNPFKCHDTSALNPLAGSLTIFSDIYSVTLPCLMCRKLSIPFRQKVALNAIFCTGLIVVFASGMRTWALIRFGTSSDITWYVFEFSVRRSSTLLTDTGPAFGSSSGQYSNTTLASFAPPPRRFVPCSSGSYPRR